MLRNFVTVWLESFKLVEMRDKSSQSQSEAHGGEEEEVKPLQRAEKEVCG